MDIPFLDLQASYQNIKPEIDDAVLRVMDSGQYILGEEVVNLNRPMLNTLIQIFAQALLTVWMPFI